MRRLAGPLILAAALSASAPAEAQTVTVDVTSGAVQRFEIAGPAKISYTGSGVVITWGPTPAPKPVDPPPAPKPVDPVPAPAPPPAPVATWGPSASFAVILDETSTWTGREVYRTRDFMYALTQAVDGDADGIAMWRRWDKDTPAPVDSRWNSAFSAAKTLHGDRPDAVLYAFDGQGRVKAVPLAGLTDAQALAAVQALKGK